MRCALRHALSLALMLSIPSVAATSEKKRNPDEPRLFEVSAPTGAIAYFQISPGGQATLFRDPEGRILTIENDSKHFPGFTIRFSRGRQELKIFSSLIFYEQKQPLPVIYAINGEYVAGIDGKELVDRATKEFHKVPEDFRSLLMSFYLFAERGIPDLGPPSAAAEVLLDDRPGALKPYDTHTREIEDQKEAAQIRAMMTP